MIDRSRQRIIHDAIKNGFTEKEALIESNKGRTVRIGDFKQDIDLDVLPYKWKISFINQFGNEIYRELVGFYATLGIDSK